MTEFFTAERPEEANGWWVVRTHAGFDLDESHDGGFLEETAKRIAAALNVCAGVKTEDLKGVKLSSLMADHWALPELPVTNLAEPTELRKACDRAFISKSAEDFVAFHTALHHVMRASGRHVTRLRPERLLEFSVSGGGFGDSITKIMWREEHEFKTTFCVVGHVLDSPAPVDYALLLDAREELLRAQAAFSEATAVHKLAISKFNTAAKDPKES